MLDALGYFLGAVLELASLLEGAIGYLPSMLVTVIIQITASYLMIRKVKSPYCYIALALFNIFALGFLFFIGLSDGMSRSAI